MEELDDRVEKYDGTGSHRALRRAPGGARRESLGGTFAASATRGGALENRSRGRRLVVDDGLAGDILFVCPEMICHYCGSRAHVNTGIAGT